MNKISAMREKRAGLWEQTKSFLDTHTDKDGKLSAEDAAAYDQMEQERHRHRSPLRISPARMAKRLRRAARRMNTARLCCRLSARISVRSAMYWRKG